MKKINLNSIEFKPKEFISKETVLAHTNDYSIFKYYVGNFTINGIMQSPFRKDKHPSFGIFFSKRNSCLLYKDLKTGNCGDCFSLVCNEVHPSFNYKEGLLQVVVDFGLQDHFIMPQNSLFKTRLDLGQTIEDLSNLPTKNQQEIGIKARAYSFFDYKFWRGYGISRETLRKYNVIPISHFTYGKKVFKADSHSYAYIERKDGETTYKIYQPYNEHGIKFFTDMNSSIHAGYTQLPAKGEVLLITKSLKDVMSITEVAGYSAVSVLSETVTVKDIVMDEYKERFTHVAVFFDNDETGKKMAAVYNKMYNLPIIEVGSSYKNCTDFSDVVFNYTEEYAKNMVDSEVYKVLVFAERNDLPF